ncbi:MAG: hypothetical protein K0R67_8 [Paenibacillus sp.]|jgi:glycosyltransferase involved in cell wall biosynthesis|nr:hypothetical protein [Paenibacillus sp.]
MQDRTGVPLKAAWVASIYRHFTGFHIPYMKLLQQKGCEVHAYAQSGEGREQLEAIGVICHDVPICRSPLRKENLKALAMLTDSFRQEKFQLVHVHTPVAALLGRIAARRAGVPCTIYTAHGFHFHKGAPLLNWLLYYPLERMMARWTDILITMNGEDWERALNFKVQGKVVYVPGVGIDLEAYGGKLEDNPNGKRDARRKLNLPHLQNQTRDAYIVLCIAELNANKNQRQLIEALGEAGTQGSDIHLVLAGTGHLETALISLAERLGVQDRVHMLGYRRDIPDLLQACDAVALLSHREGLPRAIMEAMAAGKPVLGTHIRGIRDLVAEGVSGILVPVGDNTATADALIRLRNQPALSGRMGAAGRARLVDYSLPSVMQEMDVIYSDALRIKAEDEAPAAQPVSVVPRSGEH